MKSTLKTAVSLAALAACGAGASPALAQPAASGPGASEVEVVIVTARKREETDISTPVSLTAMGAAQIERLAILNAYDLAQRMPTLTVGNTGSASGGMVYIRGIGTTVNTVASVDQSVAFDLDGVPISRGNILRIGEYDLGQVQMLKGPQALFFGKNSPAGVLAFSSKDPTDEFEVMVKLGYEPFAKARSGEFAVSGPITDTLKARIFGHVTKSDGTDKNLVAQALPANLLFPGATFAPSSNRVWGYKDKFVRGTVIWEPTDRFSARLKASYHMLDADGIFSLKERFYCARGRAQTMTPVISPVAAGGFGLSGALATAVADALAVDDCKLNGTFYQSNLNPANLTNPNLPGSDPNGALKSRTVVLSSELNYQLADHVDLTAVSGYVRMIERNYDSALYGSPAAAILDFGPSMSHRQFTQELRLRTSFDSPFNVMLGGFYQHAYLTSYSWAFAVPPSNIPQYQIPNDVYSAFGQVTWDITDQIELAAGARYTEEKKSLSLLRDFVAQPVAVPNITFHDTSPEATLTWRPSEDMTLYGAYKTGYKSGGYPATQSGNFPPVVVGDSRFLGTRPYEPESAEGFELGWKAQLLNRTLRIDATVYKYEYKNIQVSNTETVAGNPILRIFNAATTKQKGVEVEVSYYPPAVQGLRLNGMVNYNDAKYSAFLAPCWIGQSIAEGCNQDPLPPTGRFQKQNLAGFRVNNAPLWVGALGFNYTIPVADMRVEFGGDTVYRGPYNPTQELIPHARQRSSTVLNAQFRVINEKQGWEFGVYAKNLTDVRRALEYSSAPVTGVAASQGGPLAGVNARADLVGNPTPGRTVLFQLTLRPSVWLDN